MGGGLGEKEATEFKNAREITGTGGAASSAPSEAEVFPRCRDQALH